jgi:inorganic pyrophosphatase
VIRCRPVGMLHMTDEGGLDMKIVAAPAPNVFAHYDNISDIGDVALHWRERISHFFSHYKDLDKGKWVKVEGWLDATAAREQIRACVARYQECPDKPRF